MPSILNSGLAGCLLLLTSWLPAGSPAGPSKRPIRPSKTKINPLMLEFRLLEYLAKSRAELAEELVEQARYLKRFGGSGYKLSALPASRTAATKQNKARQSGYLGLTQLPILAAQTRVKAFIQKQKLGVRPDKKSARGKGRAAPVHALIGGTRVEIKKMEIPLPSLEDQLKRIGPIADFDALRLRDSILREIALINRKVNLLKGLEESLQELLPQLAQFDDLAEDIHKLLERDNRAARNDELSKSAEELAAGDKAITVAEAVGTQQLRITLTAEARVKLEKKLAKVLAVDKPRGRKGSYFFTAGLDFLPLLWSPAKGIVPRGDFRITEFVDGEELFLTLYDCWGFWEQILALEYKGKVYLQVPRI